jgi:class 3 adenylate cyclase
VASSDQPVRVGLAHGEVAALHGDFYGPTVNVAARLVGAAPPGGAVVDGAVRRLVVAPSYRFEPFDTGPLRGFDEPVPAFLLSAA